MYLSHYIEDSASYKLDLGIMADLHSCFDFDHKCLPLYTLELANYTLDLSIMADLQMRFDFDHKYFLQYTVEPVRCKQDLGIRHQVAILELDMYFLRYILELAHYIQGLNTAIVNLFLHRTFYFNLVYKFIIN